MFLPRLPHSVSSSADGGVRLVGMRKSYQRNNDKHQIMFLSLDHPRSTIV